MHVRFWGVRGSLPAPLTSPQVEAKLRQALQGAVGVDLADRQAVEVYVRNLPLYLRGTYGGNTPCLEVRSQAGDLIILDAGSGIRDLGTRLMQEEFGQGQGTAVLLFSHTHWDHIQGLPFFAPLYKPGNRVQVAARHPDIRARLCGQQDPSVFPIGLDRYSAGLTFEQIGDDASFFDGRLRVKSIRQDHPGESFGYRIEADGKAFVYATDAEYKQFTDAYLRPHIEFFRDAAVLVFDSQFSLQETLYDKADWGHSSALIGIDLAAEAGVETLVLFHHDHLVTDQQIHQSYEEALRYLRRLPQRTDLRVIVGYEGLDLQL